MANVVIFGMEFLILATKKMLKKMVFLGCMHSCLRALIGPLIVLDGRYVMR